MALAPGVVVVAGVEKLLDDPAEVRASGEAPSTAGPSSP